MQNLTLANIEIISEEVSGAGITLSHLRDELIDHLCCQVEDEMQTGLTFDMAFEKVKSILGHKGLRKVQEDTLFLIDKKYRTMKRITKNFGIASMLLIALGAMFKIQHWAGAGPLLVFGFFFLITIFFPSALWVMKKESKLKGTFSIYLISIIGGIFLMTGFLFKIQHYPGTGLLLVLGYSILALILIPVILISSLRDENLKDLRSAYIIGAVSMMIHLLGQLFKIQHYPGASAMLTVGAIGLSTVFLPLYTFKVFKNSETIKGNFIYIGLGIALLNIFSLLLAFNIPMSFIHSLFLQNEEAMKTTKLINTNNDKLFETFTSNKTMDDTLAKSEIKKVKTTSDEFCNYIEKIKIELIAYTEDVSNEEAIERATNNSKILFWDNYDRPAYYMIGESNNGKAYELKSKMIDLKKYFLSIKTLNEKEKSVINTLLDTPDEFDVLVKMRLSWENNNFLRAPLMSVENKLSSLQRNIRISENTALESIMNNMNSTTDHSEKNKIN